MHDDKEEYPLIELARRTKLLDIARNQHIKDYIPRVMGTNRERLQ